MKIAIDTQSMQGHKTGFGFYVSNLTSNLAKIDTKNQYFFLSPKIDAPLGVPKRFMWDQFHFPAMAQNIQADIIHQPCYSAPIFHKSSKIVLTIHDIIAVRYPGDLPFFAKMYFSRFMPYTYKYAHAIITDAEFTKKDLIKIGIDPKKISVIPLAVSDEYKPQKNQHIIEKIKSRFHIKGDYILNVGSLNPRKNLVFLIKVFSQVAKKHPDISLVLTGEGWYKKILDDTIASLNLQDKVIFTGYVKDDDKITLYNGAKIFAFPSLYEGFGFPPLEAMACGTPVISSNTTSLPEVVGDSGILVSPHDQKRWVHEILSLLSNRDKITNLSKRSLERSKSFSWKKCAQSTLDVYEKVYKD